MSDFLRKKNDEEAKLDALMETLNGSTAELRMALDTAQSRLAEAEKSVSSQQTEKESTLTAIALLHSRTAENAKRLTQSKEKLANILAEREKSHTRIVSMEGQGLVSLKNKISELEDGIRRLEAMEVTLQDSIRAAITAAEEARAALSMQQSTKGNGGNGAVDKIMNATKKGGALAKVTGCSKFCVVAVDVNVFVQAFEGVLVIWGLSVRSTMQQCPPQAVRLTALSWTTTKSLNCA